MKKTKSSPIETINSTTATIGENLLLLSSITCLFPKTLQNLKCACWTGCFILLLNKFVILESNLINIIRYFSLNQYFNNNLNPYSICREDDKNGVAYFQIFFKKLKIYTAPPPKKKGVNLQFISGVWSFLVKCWYLADIQLFKLIYRAFLLKNWCFQLFKNQIPKNWTCEYRTVL